MFQKILNQLGQELFRSVIVSVAFDFVVYSILLNM